MGREDNLLTDHALRSLFFTAGSSSCFCFVQDSLSCVTLYLAALGHGRRALPSINTTIGFSIRLLHPQVFSTTKSTQRNYHFIMDNMNVCKNETPFLVLMVPVAPNDVAARDAIRQTWGKESLVQGKVVYTLFMLGLSSGGDVKQQQEKLKQENLQHLDLIQSDFMDTYFNLTIKTMVIMDWLANRCPTAAYAMKIDSDMFLNIDNLVSMLQKPEIPKMNYLTGMLMWNRPVVRSKNSKWYVSEEMYPDPQYPTYTLGMGYVFSNDLPLKIVEASKSVKPFNIEDAYIGVCMKNLGLQITSPPDPSQFRAYNTGYNRCEYSKIITYILGSSEELDQDQDRTFLAVSKASGNVRHKEEGTSGSEACLTRTPERLRAVRAFTRILHQGELPGGGRGRRGDVTPDGDVHARYIFPESPRHVCCVRRLKGFPDPAHEQALVLSCNGEQEEMPKTHLNLHPGSCDRLPRLSPV
ncbi:hypothetical protein Q5P01_025559 [Channa striata]|uniref:Hexosyltransferase n=1 Tax=Channa striata TaxID=64152 RepID=A0AA88IX05_CHASR|nr:hypothetical protein Q5P01_025559 [Channa striata]